jgi:hypothetical protein
MQSETCANQKADICTLLQITDPVKGMRRVELGQIRNEYKHLLAKPRGKRSGGRPNRR